MAVLEQAQGGHDRVEPNQFVPVIVAHCVVCAFAQLASLRVLWLVCVCVCKHCCRHNIRFKFDIRIEYTPLACLPTHHHLLTGSVFVLRLNVEDCYQRSVSWTSINIQDQGKYLPSCTLVVVLPALLLQLHYAFGHASCLSKRAHSTLYAWLPISVLTLIHTPRKTAPRTYNFMEYWQHSSNFVPFLPSWSLSCVQSVRCRPKPSRIGSNYQHVEQS